MLKEFWFPLLLFLAGIPLAFFGSYMEGNGKRVMFTLTAALTFVAVLSYIWGDPVRGPFANLIRKNVENFSFQAGITCIYPVKRLSEGLDFSHCIMMPGQPIQLWVKKTWWSGLDVDLTLMGAGNNPILVYQGKQVQYLEPGFDLNHDDYALELVSNSRAPLFQLIVAKDYSTIYLNAIISGTNGVTVLKDRSFQGMTFQEAALPENKLERIFKYPSYVNLGVRQ